MQDTHLKTPRKSLRILVTYELLESCDKIGFTLKMVGKRLSRTFVDEQSRVLVPASTFPIEVNDIEREVLEDTVRASGHRRWYRKSSHATLHTAVAERHLDA
jgi:hypothetical protein